MTDRQKLFHRIVWILPLLFLLSACGLSAEAQQATITQIAWQVLETQTALVPTHTSLPSTTSTLNPTRTAAATRQPTDTPRPSATDAPDLVVLDMKIPVREGHGWEGYRLVAYLFEGDTPQVIGRDTQCEYLKVRDVKGNTGWVSNDPEQIDLRLDCMALPIGSFRPYNGYLVFDQRTQTDASGELEVSNGLAVDGVILLVDTAEEPVLAFFIRSSETYTLTEIPDGSYWLFFTTGAEWIAGENRFTENVQRQKFEEVFDFATSGSQYTIWSITLHPVAGGAAETENLSEDQFPSLSD